VYKKELKSYAEVCYVDKQTVLEAGCLAKPGSCQQWLHRYCVSATSQQYQTIKENAQSLPVTEEQQEQINSLKNTVEALKLELSLLKTPSRRSTLLLWKLPAMATSLLC